MSKFLAIVLCLAFLPTTAWTQEQCDGDRDHDGHEACTTDNPFVFAPDCTPDDPAINPDAEEILDDGLDNNCDGVIDVVVAPEPVANLCPGENLGDPDGDSFNSYTTRHPLVFCGDFNPFDARAYPRAKEHCDAVDNDGDGLTDEGLQCNLIPPPNPPLSVECDGQSMGDGDHDGVESYLTDDPMVFCGDFNPFSPYAYPGAFEGCDDLDNDGNGAVDDDFNRGEGHGPRCGALVGSSIFTGCNQNSPSQHPFLLLLAIMLLRRKLKQRAAYRISSLEE